MGKLMRLFGALIAYFSIATVIAITIIVFLFVSRVQLTKEKWSRMLAAAYGLELPATTAAAHDATTAAEQPSYEQMLEVRAEKTRNLELREQSLREGLDLLRNEQRRLVDEKKRFKQIREGFEGELLSLREGATAAGFDDVRRTLETIKPKQAKEQILKMLASEQLDQVVVLMSAMPDSKRSKIIAEFKTADEADKLAQILQRIRDGVPTVDATDKTRHQLAQPKPITP